MAWVRGPNWRRDDAAGVYQSKRAWHYRPDPLGAPSDWVECLPAFADEGDRWESNAQRAPLSVYKTTGQGVRIYLREEHNTFFSMLPKDWQVPTVIPTSEKILLEGLWANIDLEVYPQAEGYKTNYVLSSGHAASVVWDLQLPNANWSCIVTPDGDVEMLDAGGGRAFTFWRPFLVDPEGNIRQGTLSLQSQGPNWSMTVTWPDLTGISYPIVIDPSGTYNPDSGDTASTPRDGWIWRTGRSDSWATIMAGTTADGQSATGTKLGTGVQSTGSDAYASMYKGYVLFDTSGLDTGQSFSAGTLDLTGSGDAADTHTTERVDIVSLSAGIISTGKAGTSDWQGWGSTVLDQGDLTNTTWSTSGSNLFNLNATGLAEVDPDGWTGYGILLGCITDNSEPTMTGINWSRVRAWSADGTTAPVLTLYWGESTDNRGYPRGVKRGVMRGAL